MSPSSSSEPPIHITAEQAAVISPSTDLSRTCTRRARHAGKSTTVLALAKLLQSQDKNVRVVTFTRAATAELADKAAKEEGLTIEPMTMQAFFAVSADAEPGYGRPADAPPDTG